MEQSGNEDIKAFLRKPIDIDSGFLSATDALGVNKFKYDVPNALFIKPIWENKLKSIPYLRGDMVFTLNVNGSRFTQGRYLLCFLPSPGTRAEVINKSWYNLHAISLTQKTQLPHVEIDLGTQTSAQLVIPQTSFTTFYNTATNSSSNAGLLFLTPYSPLLPGSGPTDISYTLWASFENVTLSGTYMQSGMIVNKKSKKKGSDPMTEEMNNENGPISGLFKSISKFSTFVGQVPLLAPYTGPLTWASNILASTASSFGYSKPLIGSEITRMSRRVNPYGACSDGQNDSCTVGNIKNNYVKTNTGVSATEMDEMSLDFIKSQYAYFDSSVWNITGNKGDLLDSHEVKLVNFVTPLPNSCFADTPICFLARQFRYWRGSVSFRFKIVKTEFHSGRLVVAYLPLDTDQVSGSPVPTLDQTATLYRTIVDLRETSEFEICVPFAVPSVYLPVDRQSGRILVYILDKLVAPTAVSSTVTLLLEVAGGPDMEFAVPISESYATVFIPTAVQSGYLTFPCQDYDTPKPSLEPSMTSIGEKITSLRQIVKRMERPLPRIVVSAASTNSYYVRPFVNYTPSNDTLGVHTQSSRGQDSLTFITSCYAFSTGSVHVNLFPSSTDNFNLNVSLLTAATNSSLGDESGFIATMSMERAPSYVANRNIEGYFSVHVPCYNRHVARSVMTSMFATGTDYPALTNASSKGANLTAVTFSRSVPTLTGSDSYTMSRTAGEDYNCMMWVSTPTFRSQTAIPF